MIYCPNWFQLQYWLLNTRNRLCNCVTKTDISYRVQSILVSVLCRFYLGPLLLVPLFPCAALSCFGFNFGFNSSLPMWPSLFGASLSAIVPNYMQWKFSAVYIAHPFMSNSVNLHAPYHLKEYEHARSCQGDCTFHSCMQHAHNYTYLAWTGEFFGTYFLKDWCKKHTM